MRSIALAVRLAAGVTLLNLFVYAFAGWALLESRELHEGRVRISTQNLARAISINVSGVLDKIEVGLFSVADEVRRQIVGGGIDGRALNAHLARQQARIRDFEGMWVADRDANVRWGTNVPEGEPVNLADREYYQRLLGMPGSQMVISKPVIGRITKTWSILVSMRIDQPAGSLAGVALGSLRMVDYFSGQFSALDVGPRGVIALRGEDLSLVVRYPPLPGGGGGQIGGRTVSEKTLQSVRDDPDSSTYRTTFAPDGIERIVSYQKIPGYPFYVFVARDVDDYLSPWRREVLVGLSMVSAFTLFTVLVAWLIHRRAQEALAARTMERRNAEMERAMLGTVAAVSKMTGMRDQYTSVHEMRVSDLAAAIAAEMGLDAEVQRGLRVAGGVHDVGKVTLPAEILSKPGRLSPLEYEMIKMHPGNGYEILKDIDFPWPVADVAHQHHERLDGSGYPRGLKGDEIVAEARILAVADVVESMASHRPYRPSLGLDQALAEIEQGRATRYDAQAVDACLRLFREKGYVLAG